MNEVSEVRAAGTMLAEAFEQYKAVNDQRLTEMERRGSADVLLGEQLGRMDKSINNLQDQVTGLKAAMNRPGKAGSDMKLGLGDTAHKQAFLNYIKKGNESALAAFETKALEVLDNAEGGYMVPPEFSDRI